MKGRFISITLAALLVTGCDALFGGPDPTPSADPRPSETPDPDPTSTQVPVGGARQVSEETDTFLFEYAYPQKAGEIEGLAEWLDTKLDSERQSLAQEATEGRNRARRSGFPFNKYSSETVWDVVADLPGWLSLSAAQSTYFGGAHPNYGYDTIVWDKEGERVLEPIALFESPRALDEALGERLCDALNAEREKRRGIPVEEGPGDSFDACVKPDETNLLLGSRGGETIDRIGIQIAPYLAGPYAEGSYEFTFDVDAELLEIVKPEYRAAFAARN